MVVDRRCLASWAQRVMGMREEGCGWDIRRLMAAPAWGRATGSLGCNGRRRTRVAMVCWVEAHTDEERDIGDRQSRRMTGDGIQLNSVRKMEAGVEAGTARQPMACAEALGM